MNLTKCGCPDCEKKARDMLDFINDVCGDSPSEKMKNPCPESLKMPSVPMRISSQGRSQ